MYNTFRAFVFLAKFGEFCYQKQLRQEVHVNLSVCMDERSPCMPLYDWRYKGLSMSLDQK